MKSFKIIFLSDTHGKHDFVDVPKGDVLIHAGDISSRGHIHEVKAFISWFAKQPHPYKIFIGGNHDFYLENQPDAFAEIIPDNCIYLNDSSCKIEGIKIWGSPITPWFHDWAFNRQRGEDIQKHWDLIPDDTDILITHGPPYGILDKTFQFKKVGCENLLEKIREVKPKIHVFGHIHEGYGQKQIDDTLFINASTLNLIYRIAHKPVVVDWEDIIL